MSTKNPRDREEEKRMEAILDTIMPLVTEHGIARIVIGCCIAIYIKKGENPPGAAAILAEDLRQIGHKLDEENL